ncbi:ATP-binding protein [Streptomyces sp. NPDC088766]|uniref:ATP-binding protein n=1 Tax=Streptomyces sp. NPDC088766 TaxID=3365893 RepID=UPI0038215DAB
MADALVGNVFRHTAPTTSFTIEVQRTAHTVVLTVDDVGPGIEAPQRALARGQSGTSTGLGLDMAHRAVLTSQGDLHIGRAPTGGARIRVELPLYAQPSDSVVRDPGGGAPHMTARSASEQATAEMSRRSAVNPSGCQFPGNVEILVMRSGPPDRSGACFSNGLPELVG